MINNVTLVGRLVRDLELAKTNSGTAYTRFTIATDGYGEEDTNFIACVAGTKNAENMCQFVGKGSLIGITGRISVRNYEDASGQKKTFTEIVTNTVKFLESKKDRESRGTGSFVPAPAEPANVQEQAASPLDKLFTTEAKPEAQYKPAETVTAKPQVAAPKSESKKDTIDGLDNFL